MKAIRHKLCFIQSTHWLTVGRWCLTGLCFIAYSLHFSLVQGQTPTREQLTGTWVGVHAEWETDFFCPLPTYIQLDADSRYHLGMVDGSATELKSTWGFNGETIRLDTIHYAPRLVTVENDLLRIGSRYPMVFRRFSDISIDSASTYQQLIGHVWQSDNLVMSLYANGQVSLENLLTKQRTVHFWRFVRFGTSVFMVIRGNQYNRDGGYKPLWQITSVAPKQMQAIGWTSCGVATETFRLHRDLLPDESCRPSGFQTCDNCFQAIWHEAPLTRSPKRYDISQLFAKYYQPINQTGQSGLIKVQLVINCEGEQGPFELSGFGEDYCPKAFDSRITNQLRAICQDHIATDSTLRRPDPSNSPHDIVIALTFRLKDGRITDILP
jgi:hypothetical protein